jgi:tetratricopeptide (TPR) repeat protein
MFKQNPLFGVGMDRYGAYFKQFREVGYPLTHGFELTSTNAHNTFIQLFATGGIFLGLSYLILNGYIVKRAIVGMKKLTGSSRLYMASIFSAWIAFQAQSLVSIDNIGISIWGWVLGGSIIGLSVSSSSINEDRAIFTSRNNDINLKRLLSSAVPTIIVVIFITLLYRGESNTYKAVSIFNIQDQKNLVLFKDLQVKCINSPLIDPNYSLKCAFGLIQAGYTEEGLAVFKKISEYDSRNLDAINTLALLYERDNKIDNAITYREKIISLDKWNAVNYLQLGKDFKVQGNQIKSKEMFNKILTFATGVQGDPISEQAKKELAQLK